jgi:pimeloyl-ACP methyl ester carboxylesterase
MHSTSSTLWRLAWGASLWALTACARLGPADTGLAPHLTVAGHGFEHYVRIGGAIQNASEVHVYLEGDGRPFLTVHQAARDPGPHRALALELMELDFAPSLYLGRPCYHGHATAPGCSAALWTEARYSSTIVDSMVAALHGLQSRYGFAHVTLIGYSGGGALAMLVAARLPCVVRVITLAGNLDIAAWAELHRYSPLTASLNPVTQPALEPRIAQHHYVGSADQVVPPALARAAQVALHAPLEVVPGVGHVHGWTESWPSLLAQLAPASSASCGD